MGVHRHPSFYHVINHDLSSQIDGSSTIFTVPSSFVLGTTIVHHNNKRLIPGTDYTEDETTQTKITLTTAPAVGDTLTIDYHKV